MRHKGVFNIKIACAFRVQFGNVTNGARDPVESGWHLKNSFAKMFQLPKLPKMMAIGKHSHFGDTSSLFWHFTIIFFSDIDVQFSDTGKIFIGDLS